MLVVDKDNIEKSKKKLKRQIIKDDVDGNYLRDLVLKNNVSLIQGVKEDLVPSTRTNDFQMDTDSRNLHR